MTKTEKEILLLQTSLGLVPRYPIHLSQIEINKNDNEDKIKKESNIKQHKIVGYF